MASDTLKMASFMRSKEDWQLTKSSVTERFKELLSLSQWTDCTFLVGEEEVEVIKCHKLVLAVSSPVFEALFFGSLASTTEETIRVPDMEPYIFRLLLKYMYSDSVEVRNVEEAGGLLYAAKKYLMPQLSQVCLDYLSDNTRIENLWRILSIAEGLNEEQLLNPCLNVMCRNPLEVWWSECEGDRLSSWSLSKLLDQQHMNMSEVELWDLVVRWCHLECERRRVPDSVDNLRGLLDECGALTRIRFGVMTAKDFGESVASSGLLTSEECEAVVKYMESADKAAAGSRLPVGWLKATKGRFRAVQMTWKCTREMVSRDKISHFLGTVSTAISSESRVLLTGLEVFTRVAELPNYPNTVNLSHSCDKYKEELVVSIQDPEGNVLSKTDHTALVGFNTVQVVNLARPVWLSPGVRYSAVVEVTTGMYPLYRFQESARSKGTMFRFDKGAQHPRLYDISIINSILYSL